MDNYSLFIINTPFQALCTIEAIKEYKITNYKIIILRNFNDKFNSKTEEILTDFDIKYTYVFIKSFYGLLIKGIFGRFEKKLYKNEFNKIFIGDYYSTTFKLFVTFFIKKETSLILLDDGSATILLYKYGLNHLKMKNKNIIIKNKLVNFLMLFYNKNNISFFSIFEPFNNKILYKKNSLSIFETNEKKNINKKSFIIGTGMSEIGMLSEKDYFLYLKKIIEKFPNETFYYCPHRRESIEKLQRIKDTFNFKIFNTKYTIEYDLYKKNINPNIVVGFGSTALYTLKLIHNNIDAYSILFKSKSNINNLYLVLNHVYKEHGIKFIE